MIDVLHLMWNGEVGGAERAVFQLAHHQHLAGRRVAVGYGQATGHWCERARAAGVPVVDLGLGSGHDVAGTLRAVPALRGARIHHFHGMELALMVASCLFTGAGRIYTHRAGASEYSGRRGTTYRAAAPMMRRWFAVTGNTTHAAVGARKLFGLPASQPVATTYNGLDLSLLDATADRATLRRQEGVDDATVVIGTAANLRAWKRIDWLVEAAGRLPDGDWCVWILGEGPDGERLRELAARSPHPDRIRFLGRKEAMGSWLRAMDVFALPSGPEESFGNAAVEAMACGLPTIVAADSPGMIEHVEHEVTGLVVADEQDLARALAGLIEAPGRRRQLGETAVARVAERYTMERALEGYEAVYASL